LPLHEQILMLFPFVSLTVFDYAYADKLINVTRHHGVFEAQEVKNA